MTMTMDFKDLVSLYFERTNAVQVLWGLYITIALGLLAFLGANPAVLKRVYLVGLLSLGFIGFAVVNADALYDVTKARVAAHDLIANYTAKDPPNQAIVDRIKTIVNPPTPREVVIFHVSVDIGVLAAMLGLTLYVDRTRPIKK
jgi:hypothetical protein